jgi:WD40 repeat protein
LIASGSHDRTAAIGTPQRASACTGCRGHASTVTAVDFSGDGAKRAVVTGSTTNRARLGRKTGALIAELKGAHNSHVHAAAISPDGKRVLTGSCDPRGGPVDVDKEKAGAKARVPE